MKTFATLSALAALAVAAPFSYPFPTGSPAPSGTAPFPPPPPHGTGIPSAGFPSGLPGGLPTNYTHPPGSPHSTGHHHGPYAPPPNGIAPYPTTPTAPFKREAQLSLPSFSVPTGSSVPTGGFSLPGAGSASPTGLPGLQSYQKAGIAAPSIPSGVAGPSGPPSFSIPSGIAGPTGGLPSIATAVPSVPEQDERGWAGDIVAGEEGSENESASGDDSSKEDGDDDSSE